jgi:hypothetical protein
MKKSFFIITFLYLFNYAAKAQFLDSIQAAIDRKGRFSFGFNSRNSFITNYDAPIFGYMIGVCFDRKFAIGGGWNTLNSYIFKNESVDGQTVNATLNFSFFSYYIEYIFRITKHWEIDIPAAIGVGKSSYTYSVSGKTTTQNSRYVVPLEPTIEVDYNFNKYWGLFVQAGYRYMVVNNNTINENFNSPTYSYGVLLYPFEIYAGLFPHTKLAHLIEDN